jgi:hypothetical protein
MVSEGGIAMSDLIWLTPHASHTLVMPVPDKAENGDDDGGEAAEAITARQPTAPAPMPQHQRPHRRSA